MNKKTEKKQVFITVAMLALLFTLAVSFKVSNPLDKDNTLSIDSSKKPIDEKTEEPEAKEKVFYRDKNYSDVMIKDKAIRINDTAEYVNYVFGIPKDFYKSVHGWEWCVYYTDYSDLVFIGIEKNKVTAILTNAKDFTYKNTIKSGTEKKFAVNKGYENYFYDNDDTVDGVYLRSNIKYTNSEPDSLAGEIFHLTNSYRKKNDLSVLKNAEYLTYVSKTYSNDMVNRKFFSHTDPDGLTPLDRILSTGNRVSNCSENLANGYDDGVYAYEALLHSESHRANFLKDYQFTGVGVSIDKDGVFYYTQLFANPPKTKQ